MAWFTTLMGSFLVVFHVSGGYNPSMRAAADSAVLGKSVLITRIYECQTAAAIPTTALEVIKVDLAAFFLPEIWPSSLIMATGHPYLLHQHRRSSSAVPAKSAACTLAESNHRVGTHRKA